ncbi:MAG TPA: hypothetical protein VGE43_15805, partial [Acidimicrobiales bacterium]
MGPGSRVDRLQSEEQGRERQRCPDRDDRETVNRRTEVHTATLCRDSSAHRRDRALSGMSARTLHTLDHMSLDEDQAVICVGC